MSKPKVIFIALVLLVGIAASVLVKGRAQSTIGANEAVLRQQAAELASLATENERLSNQVVQARERAVTADDHAAELMQLRAKAAGLRQRADQLAKEVAETRRSAGSRYYSNLDSSITEHNHERGIHPAEPGKAGDARALIWGLDRYAREHQGAFPPSLDQIGAYLPTALGITNQAFPPLTGTNDFELVFQGTQGDLTNIPLRRVALIRERRPWLTQDGKWARVYGYADAGAETVESDDDFVSWDAQHIIPMQTGGP